MTSCPTCGDGFSSDRAMKIHHSCVHGESIAREKSLCENCDKEFEFYPSEKPGKYCTYCVESGEYIDESGLEKCRGLSGSDNPNYKGGKKVNCEWCDDCIWRSPHKLKENENQFCSESCFSSWASENYQGDGNPFWKGGYNENYSDGWWRARRKTLERDNSTCQLCGSTESPSGRNCDVHHKKPVREFEEPSDAHFLENLVTLCRPCHSLVERVTERFK